jgi:hypothetical protein
MGIRLVALAAGALVLGMTVGAQDAPNPPQGPPEPGSGVGTGQTRERLFSGWMGRGAVGTVTEVAPDHYTIKNLNGDTYTIHYSANTKVVKQPAKRPSPGMRVPPEELKPTDIRVGDAIMAEGEIDPAAKSVGAMLVVKIDPMRAREMREMQANFGKTWLAGRVTAVKGTNVTLQSPVDKAEHTFAVDENTSFRKRRAPVTLAEVEVGANVRAEGEVKEGVFVASSVTVMGMPPATGGPAPREGPPPQ